MSDKQDDDLNIKIVDIKKSLLGDIDIQKDRYKMFGPYKIDRWIIQTCMFLVFGYLLFVAWHYDFKLDYYSCGSHELEGCENPFYKPATWVNEEYLPYGEYGTKPGFLFNSMAYVVVLIFIIGFVINHFIYNKGGVKK